MPYGRRGRASLPPSGDRAEGTFGNANFFADYLVMSFFVVASLSREVTWLVRWPALAAILLGFDLVSGRELEALASVFDRVLDNGRREET